MGNLYTTDRDYIRVWKELRGRMDISGAYALQRLDRMLNDVSTSCEDYRRKWESTEEYKLLAEKNAAANKNEPPLHHKSPPEADG